MTVRVKPNHFLVDEHGNPEAVVLSLADYNRLVNLLEDRQDALSLKHAIRTSRETLSHAELLAHLKRQKLI